MNTIYLTFLGTSLEEEMNGYRGQSVPCVKSQNMSLGIKFWPFLNLNTPQRSDWLRAGKPRGQMSTPARPASYPMGVGGYFLRVKAARA
jgi:hypothetical protein